MNKKDLPLNLLLALKQVKDRLKNELKKTDIAYIYQEDLIKLYIMDSDVESKFYFYLIDCKLSQVPFFALDYCPKNVSDLSSYQPVVQEEEVHQLFLSWINLIKTYNDAVITSEDAIIKSNQERFLSEFKILDDDAETASFDLEQQLFLSKYLSDTILRLEAFKQDFLEGDIIKIDELKHEAEFIRKTLTNNTKSSVISKLSKFWATAQVIGIDVIKEIFVGYLAELTKKLITGE